MELEYSPSLGRGVIYDRDHAIYILEVEKMYQPESAAGVHLGMLMQGPGDYRTIPAGEFPFREAYDEMALAHQRKLDAILTSIKERDKP